MLSTEYDRNNIIIFLPGRTTEFRFVNGYDWKYVGDAFLIILCNLFNELSLKKTLCNA